MKKLIALLLALTVLFAIAGCEKKPAAMTYDQYTAAALDSEVIVEAYVAATESWWDGKIQVYALCEEGGYYIYDLACTEEEAAKLTVGTKIRVTGFKGEWAGEVEIMDGKFEILKADPTYFGADDVTDLVAINGLTVAPSKDANGNDVAFLYKWDGSGSQGDDLYFNVSLGENTYTFTVNVYMLGTGADSEVYKTIEGLQIGQTIDIEGFLYWYNGAQPHVTSVKVVG